MLVLAISFYPELSCSLAEDGKILCSACEKDFSVTSDNDIPLQSIDYCLKKRNIRLCEIDNIIFAQKPYNDFFNIIKHHVKKSPFAYREFSGILKKYLKIYLHQEDILNKFLDKKTDFLYSERYWNIAMYFFSIHKDIIRIAVFSSEKDKYYIFSSEDKKFGIIDTKYKKDLKNTDYQLKIEPQDLSGHENSSGALMVFYALNRKQVQNRILFPVVSTTDSYKEIFFENNNYYFKKKDKEEIKNIIQNVIQQKDSIGIFFDNRQDLNKDENNICYIRGEKLTLESRRNMEDFILEIKRRKINKAIINEYLIEIK